MKHMKAIVGVCGLAMAVPALGQTELRFEASHDGVLWSPALAAVPGNLIEVRAVVSY